MTESPPDGVAVEATVCDVCNKVHVGSNCGGDLLDGDNFILEFEKLPPDEHIIKLRKTVQQLRDDRWQATEKAQNYRRKLVVVQRILPSVQEELQKHKFVFGRLKTHTEQIQRLVQSEVKVIEGLVGDAVRRLASLEKCDGSCVFIKQDFKKLQEEYASLQALAKSRQERVALLEVQLQEKSKEAEEAQLHVKHRDLSSDNKLVKLQKDNVQMEAELKSLRKDLIIMQHHLQEEQGKLEDTQQQILELHGTIQSLTGKVSDANHNTEVVKCERNDLEAKVKAMEVELEKTNAGVKDRVDQEMLKMMKEMDQYQVILEDRLKEDVEKDKQRAKKDLEEYITEYRDNETKMMKSMRQASERYKETIADLERQIEELTQQTDGREKLLNTEIAQLNKRLNRAERIGRKSTTPLSDQTLLLQERDDKIAELSTEMDQLKDQVAELEQLVHKEVEERRQLMDDYSQIKEELLHYKMQSLGNTSPDPSTNSYMPLNIFRKRTVDKYAAYKPPESSAYDMSDIAKSAKSYRSLYDAQTQSGTKSSKSMRSSQQDISSMAGAKSSKSVRSMQQEVQSDVNGAMSSKSGRSVNSLLNQMGNRLSQNGNKSLQDILGHSGPRSVRDIMGAKSSKSRKSVVDDSALTNAGNYVREDNVGTLRKFSSLQQLSVIGREEAGLAYPDKPLPPLDQGEPVRQSMIQQLAEPQLESSLGMGLKADKPLPPLDKYSMKQKSNLDPFQRLAQPSQHQPQGNSPPRGKTTTTGVTSVDSSPDVYQTGKLAKDKIPQLPKKKSDFQWQVHDKNHPAEASAYVPMIALPGKKTKSNWHPSFDTITSKNPTPSLYGTPTHEHHPLHGPNSESMSSLSNASPHSNAATAAKPPTGKGYRDKGSVEFPQVSMTNALSKRKIAGTASNSAWKIYKNLKVGNKWA